jgi:two-component system nitrogen regulation response regulator GlnG
VGETGVGKELAARAIHEASRRRTGPFVPACLATLSPGVVESELFGHVRGTFTGASTGGIGDREGLFETARGGTLFLEEIGDTPLALQVKLLRVLETGRFCRVGSAREEPGDVRVIAAVQQSLRPLVEAGKFREDLFQRLADPSVTEKPKPTA